MNVDSLLFKIWCNCIQFPKEGGKWTFSKEQLLKTAPAPLGRLGPALGDVWACSGVVLEVSRVADTCEAATSELL